MGVLPSRSRIGTASGGASFRSSIFAAVRSGSKGLIDRQTKSAHEGTGKMMSLISLPGKCLLSTDATLLAYSRTRVAGSFLMPA